MMVTFVDFEKNLRKYYDIAKKEEVIISDGEKGIFKIIPIEPGIKNENLGNLGPVTKSLIGVFKECKDIDLDEVR